jgi:hypothetical protein
MCVKYKKKFNVVLGLKSRATTHRVHTWLSRRLATIDLLLFHSNCLCRRDRARTTRTPIKLHKSGSYISVLLSLITTNSGAYRINMTKKPTMLAKPREGLIYN